MLEYLQYAKSHSLPTLSLYPVHHRTISIPKPHSIGNFTELLRPLSYQGLLQDHIDIQRDEPESRYVSTSRQFQVASLLLIID